MAFQIYCKVVYSLYISCFLVIFLNAVIVKSAVPFTPDEWPQNATSPGPRIPPTTEPELIKVTISPLSATPLPPQKPPPALGLACNDTSMCKANNSECIKNVCTCQPGYISSKENLICLKVVSKLGESCAEDEQCAQGLNGTVGSTVCLNFICSCAIGMSLVDNKCRGPTVLNSNCSSDDDCSIIRSHCENNKCLCRDGFVPNSENNLCLSVNIRLMKDAGSMASCMEDVQCQESMGDNAICVVGNVGGGTCQCTPGTHPFHSRCIPFKDLGDECSFDEECKSKDTNTESENSRICNQNLCACNNGWKKIDNICTGGASQNSIAGVLITTLVLFWLHEYSEDNQPAVPNVTKRLRVNC